MCKTQRAISEWCLDPMDCLCMLRKHIQSFLAYSIHHSHSFTPTPLLFFFGFFWLGFSSLSFSLFLISCCFSNSSPYLFFISSLCLGFLSSISLDRWLLFFFCPHIFLLVMFAVSFFSSVFSLVSVFLPVPLCVFGHCSAAAERPPPPVAMPAREARDKARECKSTSPTNDKRVYGNCPEDQPVIKPPPGFPRLH